MMIDALYNYRLGDIHTAEFSDEFNKLCIGDKEVDLIVGGPPCQGFSVFGKRRFINTQEYDPHTDPRNALVYQYIRLVQELKPKFFFMENVKGFTNLDKGLFVENVKKQFKDLGYECSDNLGMNFKPCK